jgi:hypothetical protein
VEVNEDHIKSAGIILAMILSSTLQGQQVKQQSEDMVSDSLVSEMIVLKPVTVRPNRLDFGYMMKLASLERKVREIYPYAEMAFTLLEHYQDTVGSMNRNREKRRYRKNLELVLKERFTSELKNLTRTQGKLLVKIIERHTGTTFYSFIKTLKSGPTALSYQAIGKVYGYNLKEGYDAAKYPDLEIVLQRIERDK